MKHLFLLLILTSSFQMFLGQIKCPSDYRTFDIIFNQQYGQSSTTDQTVGGGNNFGCMWTSKSFPLSQKFLIIYNFEFQYYIDWAFGDDGLVMTMAETAGYCNGSGGNLGILGITNAIALELDTWQNDGDISGLSLSFKDCTSVQCNGEGEYSTQYDISSFYSVKTDGSITSLQMAYENDVYNISINNQLNVITRQITTSIFNSGFHLGVSTGNFNNKQIKIHSLHYCNQSTQIAMSCTNCNIKTYVNGVKVSDDNVDKTSYTVFNDLVVNDFVEFQVQAFGPLKGFLATAYYNDGNSYLMMDTLRLNTLCNFEASLVLQRSDLGLDTAVFNDIRSTAETLWCQDQTSSQAIFSFQLNSNQYLS